MSGFGHPTLHVYPMPPWRYVMLNPQPLPPRAARGLLTGGIIVVGG